jgi:PKD repeat protein
MLSDPRLTRRAAVKAFTASIAAIVVVGMMAIVPVAAAPATPGPGYTDFVYKPLADGTGADDVTTFRNQSKVWFNDGRWWAILFDKGSTANGTYRIQSFNMTTQAWTSGTTGAQVDNRNRSHADALWDGTNLWVASSHVRGANMSPNGDLRVYKYSYNSGPKTYTLASGFPKTVATNSGVAGDGTYAATIAKAPNGQLWIAYTQGTTVKVVHSTTSAGTIWGTPFPVPGQGNPIVAQNDQAAIVALSNGIGVLWSNQTLGDEAFYFAGHKDGNDDATWGARETAYGGSGTLGADGHISLKADGTGRIVAAVKTNVVSSAAALIAVLARTGAADAVGTWTSHMVSSHATGGTRPVLVLDSESSQANVFITDDKAGSGHYLITRRVAPLSTLNFGAASIGTPFISSTANGSLNNGTSTKQLTTSSSGIILLAENIPTRTYLHGCAGAVCPVAPTAGFSATPTSGQGPLGVQFTDTSTGAPTTWAWTFGDGTSSTVKNPSHTYNPGDYTVSLTVANIAGTDSVTKTNYIHVTVPPGATFTALTPTRFLDTRVGTGLSGKFVASVPRAFQVAGQHGVPANAIAITGNLTVVGQKAAGYVFLGPSAPVDPTSSTLNFPKGDVRANAVSVSLNGTGKLEAVYKAGPGKTTDLILDVTGYYVEGTSDATYTAIAPTRFLDTRVGKGLNGKFSANTPRNNLLVAGVGGVPANAIAVSGNLTVTGQTKAGYVSLGPSVTSSPTSSTINFPTGVALANAVTVPLSGSGYLGAVYKAGAGATTDLVLDITGYYTNDTSGAKYFPLSPTRLLDSRIGTGLSGKFSSSSPRNFQISSGSGAVPTAAVAITGNLTVTRQTKAGYVFLGPTAPTNPTSSTLNFPKGDTRANAVSVALSGSGGLGAVYKASPGATTDLILDVTGYFQ